MRDQAITMLRLHGPMTAVTLASQLATTPSRVDRTIRGLLDAGVLERQGRASSTRYRHVTQADRRSAG